MSNKDKKLKQSPRITDTSVTDKGEIRIEWTEVQGTDKYAVKRAESVDGEFELLARLTGTEYIDKSVKKDITYWYRIVAIRALNGKRKSKKMSSLSAQVLSDIPAPVSLKVSTKCNRIKLEWKSDADSFIVYRRNEYFNQLLPVGRVKKKSFVDEDVVSGQIYHYSIQSLCGRKQGNFSHEISCVCLDSGEIIYSKARFFRKVDLKARIVAGADGYIFERSEDGENFEEIGKTVSDISVRFTDKADKSFAAYYYRVRAYKDISGKAFVSKPSKVIRIKTK